jgi:hypothetical protein
MCFVPVSVRLLVPRILAFFNLQSVGRPLDNFTVKLCKNRLLTCPVRSSHLADLGASEFTIYPT